MRKLLVIAILILFSLLSDPSMAEDYKLITTLSDKHIQAIQLATKAFAEKNLNPSGYNLILSESEDSYIVSFEHSSKQKGFRGSPEGHPGFNVIINKENLVIIDTHFIR